MILMRSLGEWIKFGPGVVPAINMLIRAFTETGDKVIIQRPVYYPFFISIENNHRQILDNPLKYIDGDERTKIGGFHAEPGKALAGRRLYLRQHWRWVRKNQHSLPTGNPHGSAEPTVLGCS